MSENIQRETAKIIRFPLERRVAVTHAQPVRHSVVERPATVSIETGSGWYHDAAINDANMSSHR